MTLKTYDVELQIDKQIAELNREAKLNKANDRWIEASSNYGAIVALIELKAWLEDWAENFEKGQDDAKG